MKKRVRVEVENVSHIDMDTLNDIVSITELYAIEAQLPIFTSLKSSLHQKFQEKFLATPQTIEEANVDDEWSQTTTD